MALKGYFPFINYIQMATCTLLQPGLNLAHLIDYPRHFFTLIALMELNNVFSLLRYLSRKLGYHVQFQLNLLLDLLVSQTFLELYIFCHLSVFCYCCPLLFPSVFLNRIHPIFLLLYKFTVCKIFDQNLLLRVKHLVKLDSLAFFSNFTQHFIFNLSMDPLLVLLDPFLGF